MQRQKITGAIHSPILWKLFVIGDPKQSIYRFRRADIEMYTRLARKLVPLALTANFRAESGVLDFTNRVFKRRITLTGDYQPAYEALTLNPDKTPDQTKRIVAVEGKSYHDAQAANDADNSTDMPVEEFREMEADLTAAWLKANHGQRFPKYSDVTILFRAYAILPFLQDAFERAGIPYTVAGGKSYFARDEIRALLMLLRAIADPGDRIAIAAALRSPFFGYSDQALLDWRTGSPDGKPRGYNYHSPVVETELPNGGLAVGLARLAELHHRCSSIAPAGLVFELIHDPGLMAGFAVGYRGAEKLQNLLKAAEFVRMLPVATLAGVCRGFQDAIDQGLELGDLDLAADTGDAIKLMSLHKAKGLENEVVYLVNGGTDADKKNNLFVGGGKLYTASKTFCSYDFEEKQTEEQLRTDAEDERLRYVAVTRAKQFFVINTFPDYKKGSFAGTLDGDLETDQDLVAQEVLDSGLALAAVPTLRSKPVKPKADTALTKADTAWRTATAHALEQGSTVHFTKLSPSHLPSDPSPKTGRRAGMRVEDFPLPLDGGGQGGGDLHPSPETGRREGMRVQDEDAEFTIHVDISDADQRPTLTEDVRANVLGTVVHKLLEFGDKLSEKELSLAAAALAREHGLALPVPKILEFYQSVGSKECCRESQRSPNAHHELALAYTKDAATLISGTIDLLYESEKHEGWVVGDYKIITDTTKTKKEIEEEYTVQQQAYKTGLGKAAIDVKHLEIASL